MPSGQLVSSTLPGHHPHRRHRRLRAHLRSSRQTSGQGALARPLLIAQKERGVLQTAVGGALRSQGARSIGGRDRLGKSRLASGGVIVSRACLHCLADDMRSRSSSNRLASWYGNSRCTSITSFATSNVPLHFIVSLTPSRFMHVIANRQRTSPASFRLFSRSCKAKPLSTMPTSTGQTHLAASQKPVCQRAAHRCLHPHFPMGPTCHFSFLS